MAFVAKSDYFGLATTGLSCVSNADGKTASVAEGRDSEGTIVAWTVYGETSAPTNSYVVGGSSNVSLSVTLGSVSNDMCLNNFQIDTSVGNPPTVTASGEQVETGATANCTYTIPSATVSPLHHAQILFSMFSVSGDGCHLQSANYTASATLTKATKDGVCVAHDVSEAKIEAQVTVLQTSSTAPTVAAGTGCVMTAPLACTNPDADYPTWTCTITKYLTQDA